MKQLSAIIMFASVHAIVAVALLNVGVLLALAPVSQDTELTGSGTVGHLKVTDQPEGLLVPKSPDMSQLRTLEEAQKEVDFAIKPPLQGIPPGFFLKGVLVSHNTPEIFEGNLHTVTQATLVYWNKSTTKVMDPAAIMLNCRLFAQQFSDCINRALAYRTLTALEDAGGLFVEITNDSGSRTIDGLQKGIRPVEVRDKTKVKVSDSSGDLAMTYLWGNPAIIGPKNIAVYDFNTHLQYRVYGNHPQDVLMKIMESLIRE